MLYIIFAIYGVMLISFSLMFFFIIYHLAKYSINRNLQAIMIPFFAVISALLLFSNIILFFSVDWNSILLDIF
jgi:hypothetical protein